MLSKTLFPALGTSLALLLTSPFSSGKEFGVLAQNATATAPARPMYFRLLGDVDFGSPGGSTCGSSYCTGSESCCNGGCCPAGSSCMLDGSGCCSQGANCTAPDPSQICLDATADGCYPLVRVWASQICCPTSLSRCMSKSGFGTGCFAASTMISNKTSSPQWQGWNSTQASNSTVQPSDIIMTVQSTVYVTKTVVYHSSSTSSSMNNPDTVTPNDPAPSSVDGAAIATFRKTEMVTLTSSTTIITSKPRATTALSNEPTEVQPQAVAALPSVVSMNKGSLAITAYDPLDCSGFYFCTDLATISSMSTRVTYLCDSLHAPHVTAQAIADGEPSTVYTTTTTYTTITPTSYATENPIISAQAEEPSISTVTSISTSVSTPANPVTSTSVRESTSTTTEYFYITHHRIITVTQTYGANSSAPNVRSGFSPVNTSSLLTPLSTNQALAARVPDGVTTVTTTATSVITTVTVTTTEVIDETETPCNTATLTLPLSSSSILTSQSLIESTSQNLSKTVSSGTSELSASTIASMPSLKSSSSITSLTDSAVSGTSHLSSSGSEVVPAAPPTMSSAMTSNSEVMATGSTTVSSNSKSTPNITPPVSLCYDSEHNTNGPCSKTSSTGYYAGASTVPLGSNASGGQMISCLVVSIVVAIQFAAGGMPEIG